jgi:ABC-type uncharacterized transport system permease subunit
VLAIVVLACYLAAALWLGTSAQRASAETSRGRRIAGIALGCIAVITHAVLLWQTLNVNPNLALNAMETASAIGLCLAILAIANSLYRPSFAIPNAVLLVLAAILSVGMNSGGQSFATSNQGWELTVHIALSVLAYSLITFSAALAIVLALLDRRLRRRQPLGWLARFPAVAALENGMFQALIAGFAILSLALFSGFIFIQDFANLRQHHLPHKVVFSVLAWICLAILVFGRLRFGWRGRKALYWTIGTLTLLVIAYFGSKFVLESLLGQHWG